MFSMLQLLLRRAQAAAEGLIYLSLVEKKVFMHEVVFLYKLKKVGPTLLVSS